MAKTKTQRGERMRSIFILICMKSWINCHGFWRVCGKFQWINLWSAETLKVSMALLASLLLLITKSRQKNFWIALKMVIEPLKLCDIHYRNGLCDLLQFLAVSGYDVSILRIPSCGFQLQKLSRVGKVFRRWCRQQLSDVTFLRRHSDCRFAGCHSPLGRFV